MDAFKSITPNTSVVKISACLSAISKTIVEGKQHRLSPEHIKEVEFLKSQCKNESSKLVSLMSVQAFVYLVENGTLEIQQVLTMFISMLPNSSPSQYTSISEGIISLLLINLKRKAATLKPNEKLDCPYGIKSQQHPIITLIQNNPGGMDDIANKINGICNNFDSQIRENCIEYLRPTFLFVLCNPQTLPNAKTIWTTLLSVSKSCEQAKELIWDVISWSRLSTPSTCLFTSILLIEAIEIHESNENFEECINLVIYQALVANELVKQAIDSRPSFQCILRTLQTTQKYNRHFYNVLLVLLADIVHSIPPTYLTDLIRIIHFIIVKESCGNQYLRNMALDGIIQWMSQTGFIPSDALELSDEIIKATTKNVEVIQKTSTEEISKLSSRYLHPDIALAMDIAHLIENFDADNDNIVAFVNSLSVKSKPAFCGRINLFLRAIFLSTEPSVDCWYKIYEIILSIIKSNELLAFDFLMTYLYKLGKVTDPDVILELFKGLPSFAVSKDNVPMILNTLKSMKNGKNTPFVMDLYMKLWKVEGRTYPFLVKTIAEPFKIQDKMWEHQVAKNYVIREICYEKPSQYGRDLVSQISDTLNNCTTEEGDLATSLALDAIVCLCESNTVSITSTWKAIGDKFRHETRPRSLKSLYNFFAHVPLLQSPTLDYEELVDESLAFLWSTIRHEETTEFTNDALNALKHYVGNLQTVRHIPVKFKNNLNEIIEYGGMDLMDLNLEYVPGECWVQLLQKIRPDCGAAAADLVSHYISEEINAFKSGVYRLSEGRPEPKKFQGLYKPSILQAVVTCLVTQSRYGDQMLEKNLVTNALRAISKKYSKPMPPLDWTFIKCFFHISFETRKYCILICKNQVLISESAKRLLENYVQNFEPNCFEEDLLLLLSILPELVNGICLNIIKIFIEKIADYCFKESQLNGFVDGCLFEKFLDSVRDVFASNFEFPEALDYFTLIVERYMDTMDYDSRLFERYTELISTMSQSSINHLTSPANWVDISIPKLKKATLVRCYLVLYSSQLSNPLMWFDDSLIDAYFIKNEELLFFERHFTITLHAFNDDKNACAWLMELMIQIQALLAEYSNKEKLKKVYFLLDVFILAVELFSGCAILLGNLEQIASCKEKRFIVFPESLQILCDRVFWKDNEGKIYEFLYRLFNHSIIEENYKETFRKAIICSRNKPYFENKAVWMKYVGLKK